MSAQDIDNNEILLAPVLDLCAAAPLMQELKARRGDDAVIDASQVTRIGAQCMQVLLSAVNSWGVDGKKLTILNATPVFSETTSELDVNFQISTANEEEICQ